MFIGLKCSKNQTEVNYIQQTCFVKVTCSGHGTTLHGRWHGEKSWQECKKLRSNRAKFRFKAFLLLKGTQYCRIEMSFQTKHEEITRRQDGDFGTNRSYFLHVQKSLCKQEIQSVTGIRTNNYIPDPPNKQYYKTANEAAGKIVGIRQKNIRILKENNSRFKQFTSVFFKKLFFYAVFLLLTAFSDFYSDFCSN